MITQINIRNQGTFSTLKIATGIMATAFLANNIPAMERQEHERIIKVTYHNSEKSYQETKVLIASENQYLTEALQSVYEKILSNQRDFDVGTKKIIYENLWDLYS